MTNKAGRRPEVQRARALAVLAAVAVLTASCGVVHVSFGNSGSTGPAAGPTTYRANLAFAHCMQTHGLPSFPDPGPSSGVSFSKRVTGNSSSPAGRAYHACEHLLTRVSATTPATASSPGGAATVSPP